MGHPKLVAWFDDLEDAVAAAMRLSPELRSRVRALRAPRDNTWVMLAPDSATRDILRQQLSNPQQPDAVTLARDCHVLDPSSEFGLEEDTFERDNGFGQIEVDYTEEGSADAVRLELLADADDYAAAEETGWFYSIQDDDREGDEGNFY